MIWKFLNICVLCYISLGLSSRAIYAAKCRIPRGAQYRRSEYRPTYARITERYAQGETIRDNTRIVAICKSDIYHDAVRAWTRSKCIRGRWVPALPKCKVKKRCRAPPSVEYATASERITPYITFPHDTTVTYTCDADKMATGSSTIVCEDGTWATTNFACTEIPVVSDLCNNINITNGNVSVTRNDMYDVTCNVGFRLRNTKPYRCRHGEWIGDVPTCIQVRCEITSDVRSSSVLKFKVSGKVLHSRYINHWTQVVQSCKDNSRTANTRTVRCVNGRWRPQLMYCPKQRAGSIRHWRTYIDCVIPNIYDDTATYSDVISGSENAFQMGDMIQHGRTVLRVCTAGVMSLSSPSVKISSILITVCTNGKWKPHIPPCLRNYENDAVFLDPAIESTVETTTIKPAMESTTNESPIKITVIKPAMESTTKESPVTTMTIKPAIKSTTNELPVETTTKNPDMKSTTNELPAETTTIKPDMKSTTNNLPAETTTIKPDMKSTTNELPSETTTIKPDMKSTTNELPVEKTIKPDMESTTIESPVETTIIKQATDSLTESSIAPSTGRQFRRLRVDKM